MTIAPTSPMILQITEIVRRFLLLTNDHSLIFILTIGHFLFIILDVTELETLPKGAFSVVESARGR